MALSSEPGDPPSISDALRFRTGDVRLRVGTTPVIVASCASMGVELMNEAI